MGLMRGLIGTVIITGAIFLAFFLSRGFSGDLLDFINVYSAWFRDNVVLGSFVSSAIIFIAVILVAIILIRAIRSILTKITIVGWLDKVGGLTIGLAAGVIVVFFALTYAYNTANESPTSEDFFKKTVRNVSKDVINNQLDSSYTLPYVVAAVDTVPESVIGYAPKGSLDAIEEIKSDQFK